MIQNTEVLMDTHVFVWLMNGSESLNVETRTNIERVCQQSGKIYVSAISVWEIGMLEAKGRIHLKEPVSQWIDRALKAPCIYLAPLTQEILIESCYLPGTLHADPADRMIISTARILSIPIITRDSRILEYATQGYINALEA
jgi:PIN domain nuclease of toxin-antitoxin system